MKRINVYDISAYAIVSYALATMVTLGILANTTTSGFPSGSTLPLLAATTVANGESDRDKSGTGAVQIDQCSSQSPQFTGVMNDHANSTERGRFELPRRFKPPTAFPVLLLQPLGHLSKAAYSFIAG